MRNPFPLVATAFMAVGLVGNALAQDVRTISLPAELSYPEGIGYDPAGYIYTASAADGTVVRTELETARSEVITKQGVLLAQSNETFPNVLGMKVDRAKQLWLAGGRTGKVFVIDTRNGRLVKTLATPGEGGLLNDLVVTADAIYVTDTRRPTLWKIPFKGEDIGQPEAWLDFNGTALQYGEGPNLNGIAKTPNDKTLFVVQMNKGLLFKIDVATKALTSIDIGGEQLTGGDGLELDGQTLYVVRQPAAEVVTVALAPGFAAGKVTMRLQHPALQWPATAVKVGHELVIVNSQFNKRATNAPVTPFSVIAIPLTRLNRT
jgi:sugar lactone lactonase YvrE